MTKPTKIKIQLVIEVEVPNLWSNDHTLGQVRKQAQETARSTTSTIERMFVYMGGRYGMGASVF